MAAFVVRVPYTPDEYNRLTMAERDAIIEAWNSANARK